MVIKSFIVLRYRPGPVFLVNSGAYQPFKVALLAQKYLTKLEKLVEINPLVWFVCGKEK
jgi:hypothetical protein